MSHKSFFSKWNWNYSENLRCSCSVIRTHATRRHWSKHWHYKTTTTRGWMLSLTHPLYPKNVIYVIYGLWRTGGGTRFRKRIVVRMLLIYRK
jgi:hypothetical protein